MKRVVVTGMGALSPCGNSINELWESIRSGNIGIDFIKRFDTSDFKVKLAAEIKNLNIEDYIDRKDTKRMDLYCQYAMAAAKMAIEDSGLTDGDMRGNERMGIMLGSGIGGLATLEEQITKLAEKGPNRVSPLFIPMCIGNMAAGNLAIKYGFTGTNMAHVTACAAGAHSIGEAYRNIKHGYSDIIIAGGAEASITRIGIAGFSSLTALTQSEDPSRASIPFDKDRSGFVMGEGAGVLILEELEHALTRGAKIYGEIAGYGANGDAHHMTAPNPEGTSAAKAIQMAMNEAGIEASDVGYINAHGTSTMANDLPETNAIKLALGEHAYSTAVSSTKSMTGHLLGAAGAIEAIICIQALIHSFLPPTVGLETPGEGCDLDYISKTGRPKEIQYALSNSFGFGGHNAVLCLKKWEDK